MFGLFGPRKDVVAVLSSSERTEYIGKRIHRSLHQIVQDLNLSDEELQRLGREHYKDQAAYLQKISRNVPDLERLQRRGPECGLDSRDFQEAADDRWLEEDEAGRHGRLW
eukprot:symbB.v1.2.033269.t1/scaffold4105.1/size64512/1